MENSSYKLLYITTLQGVINYGAKDYNQPMATRWKILNYIQLHIL